MRTNYPHHLPGFDYLGIYRYFLTFCTHRRARLFDDHRPVDIVMSQFLRAASEEGFAIIASCFMPDHVHMVVEGLDDRSELKRFVVRAKQYSGYHFKREMGTTLWQRYGYEHVLRDQEPTRAVVAYVLENPVRANLAAHVAEYPHIRSSLYTRAELIEYAYGSPRSG